MVKGTPELPLVDGYYVVTPIKGSEYMATVTHIYNKGNKEDYLALTSGVGSGTVVLDVDMENYDYFEKVLAEGGTILPIPKEKFDALMALYQ